MVRIARIGLALFAFSALGLPALSSPLAAQELASGTWTGSLTGPDGQSFPVEYEVVSDGDDLSITMIAPGQGEMPFERISREDGVLSMGFEIPGVSVDCELTAADDGSLEGDCTGSDGQSGVIKMIPPSDG